MQGKIVKGIAGFYYVHVVESGVYECKAKGIFRKEGQKPLVGDLVEIEILDEAEKTGNMTRILPRKNELIRPAVANIDQALVIFALENPTPNLTLLDRFLVMMEQQNVPTLICFNKEDLASEAEIQELRDAYGTCGYPLFFVSARHLKKGLYTECWGTLKNIFFLYFQTPLTAVPDLRCESLIEIRFMADQKDTSSVLFEGTL